MSKYRNNLPQLSDKTFLTDGGLETTLVFKHEYDLPQFAAFDLFKHREGFNTLKSYYRPYIDLALHNQVNFILESPTWRASKDWGAQIGYDEKELHDINRAAIDACREQGGISIEAHGLGGNKDVPVNVIHRLSDSLDQI